MPLAFLRRASAIVLSAALPVVGFAACGKGDAEGGTSTVALSPADTALASMAAAMVRARAQVDGAWPGHWPAGHGFVLMKPPATALLVSGSDDAPGYDRVAGEGVPAELAGKLWRAREYPAVVAMNHRVGGQVVPAMEPRGSTPYSRLFFYYHEAFHGHQSRAFARRPDEPVLVDGKRTVDSASIAPPEFAAAGEVERRMLVDALRLADADSLRALLRAYLAVRAERTGRLPDVRRVERHSERMEGTATFVGCRAARAVLGSPEDSVLACIRRELTRPLHLAPPAEADARLMRWRHYGTGAAMAYLLERLGDPDWRKRVEEGAPLDEVLARAVGIRAEGAAALAAAARERYGFAALVREERARLADAAARPAPASNASRFAALVPATAEGGECRVLPVTGTGRTLLVSYPGLQNARRNVTVTVEPDGTVSRYGDVRGDLRGQSGARTAISIDLVKDEGTATNRHADGREEFVTASAAEMLRLPALGHPRVVIEEVRRRCGLTGG